MGKLGKVFVGKAEASKTVLNLEMWHTERRKAAATGWAELWARSFNDCVNPRVRVERAVESVKFEWKGEEGRKENYSSLAAN